MIGLHPFARIGLQELRRDAARLALRFQVSSARRDRGAQARLYARYVRGDPRQRYPVAPPGRSTHEWGLAIDVVADNPRRQAELTALARRLGWVWGGPRDPIHHQVVEARAWPLALALSPKNPLAVLARIL